MSIKIKISYTTSQELQKVIELLRPYIKSCKTDKGAEGKYRKAYIELKE